MQENKFKNHPQFEYVCVLLKNGANRARKTKGHIGAVTQDFNQGGRRSSQHRTGGPVVILHCTGPSAKLLLVIAGVYTKKKREETFEWTL